MVTPQDVLVRAYDLLSEFGIGRGQYAQDAAGYGVDVTDPRAVAFCSVGSVMRARYDLGLPIWDENNKRALELLYEAGFDPQRTSSITGWNDRATDEEILATFRKAAGLPEPSKPVEELTEAHEQVLVTA